MEVRKIKNIGFPVEDKVYADLKILCFKKGITLKEFLTALIIKELQKQDDENVGK